MTQEGKPCETQGVGECRNVADPLLRGIGGRPRRLAMAPLVEDENAVCRTESPRDAIEIVRVHGEAVQHDERGLGGTSIPDSEIGARPT